MDAPLLMPEPNRCRFLDGIVRLTRGDGIWVSPEITAELPRAVEACSRALRLPLVPVSDALAAKVVVRRPHDGDVEAARGTFASSRLERVSAAGSYFLEVGDATVTAAAADRMCALYALQTLSQLVVSHGDVGTLVKRARIVDYPHLPIRGVHLYLPAREQLGFCRRLIDALAHLKYNRICFEVSGMEFLRHPEINRAWVEYARDMDEYPEKAKAYQNGSHSLERPWYKNSIHIENAGGRVLSQAEVRDLVSYSRERGLEVVPEVQSLSHCDYLVIPHREIAEIPEDPYPDSYCPSNPASYELLFDVIDEVIDVFEPRTVHIGHDEWYTPGYCPACRGKDAAELLAADVQRIHGHLASRGISTEMFGDKLLNAHTPDGRGQGGAQRVVENYSTSESFHVLPATWRAAERIPKDVCIAHWYWGIEPRAVAELTAAGLESIYFANFSGPQVKGWHESSRCAAVRGGVLSHWDQVDLETMAREGTLTDIVYSSTPLWSEAYSDASWPDARDATIRFLPRFMRILRGEDPLRADPEPGSLLIPWVRHEARDRLYMDTAAVELRSYEETTIRYRSPDGYLRGAIVAQVERGQSGRVAVLDDRVDALIFRHNTTISLPWRSADKGYRPEDYRLGQYTVRYAGGAQETIELSYGRNIGCAAASWGRAEGELAYTPDIRLLQTACHTVPEPLVVNGRDPVTVYTYEWTNPHPETPIEAVHLTLEPRGEPFSIFVYGIRGRLAR